MFFRQWNSLVSPPPCRLHSERPASDIAELARLLRKPRRLTMEGKIVSVTFLRTKSLVFTDLPLILYGNSLTAARYPPKVSKRKLKKERKESYPPRPPPSRSSSCSSRSLLSHSEASLAASSSSATGGPAAVARSRGSPGCTARRRTAPYNLYSTGLTR